ncbi:MAG: hypothetical protein ACI4CE_07355 [Methanomethylophilus alvi]
MLQDMHYTGCFVICNYGPYGNIRTVPAYLASPISGVKPHHYTTNICKADFFAYKSAAENQMANENAYLKAEGHPLAGQLFVAEVFTRPIPKEGQ